MLYLLERPELGKTKKVSPAHKGIRTYDYLSIRRGFYHCATTAAKVPIKYKIENKVSVGKLSCG